MRGERSASQSEVSRATLSGYSPCCGIPHRQNNNNNNNNNNNDTDNNNNKNKNTNNNNNGCPHRARSSSRPR